MEWAARPPPAAAADDDDGEGVDSPVTFLTTFVTGGDLATRAGNQD